MDIYIVTTNYFESGVFGVYSSLKRARLAFETFISEDVNIVGFSAKDDCWYEFISVKGETFYAEIQYDILDPEFENELIKEDE